MPQPRQSSGIGLKAAPKTYSLEQDKTSPPDKTVAWAKKRFAAMGADVLRKTVRIDTGRLGVPVYMSVCGSDATLLTGTSKQMGKGASPAQAEASALMELAERFSFFSYIRNTDFPVGRPFSADGREMDFSQAAKAVGHPAHDLKTARKTYELVPQRFAWAKNLTLNREELIPLDWFYTINEYNGPAAGNCQEEALLQSLCEVVERHVSALVSLEKMPTPAIDPKSVDDNVARELLDKFDAAGIKVFLKDFTLGMGIPTVAAICYDPANFPENSEIVYTAGTAASPAKALIRALTEVAQLAGDFENRTSYLVSALPKFETLEEAEYVTRAKGTVSLNSLPDLSGDDIKGEIDSCVKVLEQNGFSVYSINTTHEDLGIPAVYTIIPGAHFAERTTGTDVYFHAAKLASQLADPELALEVLERIAGVAPDSYHLRFFRSLALINLKRPDQAIEGLKKALSLGPTRRDEASIHTQIGVALKDMGRYLEAVDALHKAAEFPEPHHEVYNLLGFCHFMLKEHEKSIEAFSRAIEIEPGEAINYANIGSNFRELGRIKEACSMYRHALDLDPGLDFAKENLSQLEAQSD